jgi:hypothetical protein
MTLTEVKFAALELLGVSQEGVAMTSTHSTRMGRSYDKVFSELKETGLATWIAAGPIPDELADHVEALMAYEASSAYFVSDNRYNRIVQKVKVARRELRRLTIPDHESLDEPVDY